MITYTHIELRCQIKVSNISDVEAKLEISIFSDTLPSNLGRRVDVLYRNTKSEMKVVGTIFEFC